VKITFLVLILVVTLLQTVVLADSSLWSDQANLYQDKVVLPRSFKVGDVVTIIIEEDADAIQMANINTGQDSSFSASPGTGILDFLKALGFSYSDQGSAEGQTEQSGKLEADITAVIRDILPGGNFYIAGTKKIRINNEEQKIIFSGMIRPDDITEDNTISSKKVADANIEYQSEGIISDKQEPGLLERLFNWIF
jgi:flagellar L-ring protein FlgH